MANRPATLLLIDDDDVEAEMVSRSLRKANLSCAIYRARDGVEALQMLTGRHENHLPPPVLVLLDLNLPRMSGFEFLDEVRTDPNLKNLTVFVLTTSNDERDRAAAYDRQVSGYLLKCDVGSGSVSLVDMVESVWRPMELPTPG